MNTEHPDAGTSTLSERYQIRRHLGSGGNGDAYLAWDTSLRREVVIKRVRTGTDDEDAVQHILEEAEKTAALRHPNIVSIYDISMSEGSPCIIMEHVHGENLDDRVTTSGPLSLDDFVELARQTLEALVAAHKGGLIHRDLKPSNIMLSDLPSGSFQAKLLDFGMAKFIEPETPSPQTVLIDGSIRGSIQFISPEQLNRDPVDQRSDLYSLGCSLYFSVTGQNPFLGETIAEVITSHLNHQVLPPSTLRPELKPALNGWLMKLLQRNPQDRFPDALTALRELKEAAMADGILRATTSSIRVDGISSNTGTIPAAAGMVSANTGNIPSQSPARQRMITAAMMILAALLAGGAVWYFLKPGSDSSEKQAADPAGASSPTVAVPPPVVAEASLPPVPASTPAPAAATPVPSPAQAPVAANPSAEVVFTTTGSNTIGAALMPALMKGFLGKLGASDIREEPHLPEETLFSFRMPGAAERQGILIQAHGSSTSFKALEAGKADIGMSSRPIKDKEVEKLAFLGDMLSRAAEHVVGLDGLAVIVNHANPVQSLTVSQVADIFSGAITDWSQVGGNPGPIHLYARDDKSGTYDSFKTMVLGDKELRGDSKRFEDSNALSDDVAKDPVGIGFIGLPYVRNSKALTLSDEETQPMYPTPFTVATEDYVLARRLFIYTPVVPNHPWTLSFVEFALSDEGQQIVEDVGFVPQYVEVEKVVAAPGMPPDYARFVTDAEGRLSTNFRFRTGKSELDAKGLRDLDRVIRFLARPENRRKQVYLLGFSDSSGSEAANLAISEERAQVVAAQLGSRGIQPAGILAFGSAMPVASNETVGGQNKNRRVEIWIK